MYCKKTPLLVFTFELDKTHEACDQLFYKTGLITTTHLFCTTIIYCCNVNNIFFCQIKGSFQNYQFEINHSRYKTICLDKTTFSDVSGQLVKLDWISEKST